MFLILLFMPAAVVVACTAAFVRNKVKLKFRRGFPVLPAREEGVKGEG